MLRRIAMCQMNARVGDIRANTARIVAGIREAKSRGAQVVTFPELAVTGYPPEDLVYRREFLRANMAAIGEIAAETKGITAVVGYVRRHDPSGKIFNSTVTIRDGQIVHEYDKILLPNYGVFDEKRYFTPGTYPSTFTVDGKKVAVTICEDIWDPEGPTIAQAEAGAGILLSSNASPMYVGKLEDRFKMLCERAKQTRAYIFYNNLVGGQDELVFDGGSMVISPEGKLLAIGKQFVEDMVMVDLDTAQGIPFTALSKTEEMYEALKLAVRDYYEKSGVFKGVVVAVSGGIDSAFTMALAVDALGWDRVWGGVYMPSQYSAGISYEDARALCENFGIPFKQIPISGVFGAFKDALAPEFAGQPEDVAEENLQARTRGDLVMALSNRNRLLVLTTGNKSEMAVGYCTLYGDMAGGFAVIKDVYKTDVFAMSRWRNTLSPAIPERTITRPPSAELKDGQQDTDSLPPYDILDPILAAYMEENLTIDEIVARGFDRATVVKVMKMVDGSEYKRRQGAPGPKVTPRAFGKDWRLPICNGYRAT